MNASKRIPRSLLWSTTANKISCIICGILIVLCAGDVDELFAQPLGISGHPLGAIVQLIYNASRKNKALASAPFGLVAPIFMMCCINTTAAASRMVFSFIRDDHNPVVHKVMARVSISMNSMNNMSKPYTDLRTCRTSKGSRCHASPSASSRSAQPSFCGSTSCLLSVSQPSSPRSHSLSQPPT